jgi:2-polyprenyl-3-methyl-5-hydroxy-6-metoxy-1,4-benzoquinol methylase
MNEIFEFYKNISTPDNDIKTLGWGSKESQKIRFEQFICHTDDSNTILDVGCGYGDLSKYFKNYTGIDVRESAILVAKSKYPDKVFFVSDIDHISENYDWIFASGIFCHKLDDTYQYIEENLNLMFNRCNIGIATNFLSDYSKTKNNNMFYCDISILLKIIEKITKKFIIKTNYLNNDFTIILFKE